MTISGISSVSLPFSGQNENELVNLDEQVANLPPRRYPPIGQLDTIEGIRDVQGNLIFTSAHGTCSIFKDREILQYHAVLRKELLGNRTNIYGEEEKVYIDFTQNNKAIIQQQATRGCTAATAAMLIKDRGRNPNLYTLQERNLGNDEDIKQDIQAAGFKPIISLTSSSLETLRKQLLKSGSAIISLEDPQAGAHSIVVDEVSEDLSRVRLRDPYHGWEITVSAEAFQSRWQGNQEIIQIALEVFPVEDEQVAKSPSLIRHRSSEEEDMYTYLDFTPEERAFIQDISYLYKL